MTYYLPNDQSNCTFFNVFLPKVNDRTTFQNDTLTFPFSVFPHTAFEYTYLRVPDLGTVCFGKVKPQGFIWDPGLING